jgi:hypothetical protein
VPGADGLTVLQGSMDSSASKETWELDMMVRPPSPGWRSLGMIAGRREVHCHTRDAHGWRRTWQVGKESYFARSSLEENGLEFAWRE